MQALTQVAPTHFFTPVPRGLLQRKCACGGSAGTTGECETCKGKKLLSKPLQGKLAINEPGDQYEQEADRVAEQVMQMEGGDSIEPMRQSIHTGEGTVGRMPILQRAEEGADTPTTEGDKPKEEGSRCPSWRGDPQSISKRAGEFYARNHLTPPSQATVERIECEPPRSNGNYGCYVHFSDGLVLRVIVRETDIVVGTGPGPITTEHPPPATPLCFYEYSCPEGDLVLTVKKCQSARPSGSTSPPAVAQRSAASDVLGPMTAPPIVHDVLNSPGQPLDSATRAFFEPRFGHDFGRVRVHAGEQAEQSAQDINAHAYTVGHHIVFGAGRLSPHTVEGLQLLAHELTHVVQQTGADAIHVGQSHDNFGGTTISLPVTEGAAPSSTAQRQPSPPAEAKKPTFESDRRKRTWRRYARSLGKQDAARIRKLGKLTAEDRKDVNAKLRFFEGEAMWAYIEEIKPVLEDVTRNETQTTGDAVSGTATKRSTKPKLEPYDLTSQFDRLRRYPEYIDNNIKEVNYFTAELAIIHYKDGSTYELGLVPKWMKPPVVEVDYHTPAEDFRKFEDATTGRFGFMIESEMANAPRSLPYQDLLKTYVHYIDFYIQSGTARIVPSRINMLTAPTLCRVLLDSEHRYLENVDMAVQVGIGGTIAIGGYAGAGGLPKNTGVGLGTTTATRLLSPTARTLAREMDSLLVKGGTKTITVEGVKLTDVAVSKQGSTLAVRRFESRLPHALRGQGIGPRVTRAFEDAAVEVGRLNGAKKVTVDVGIITNPGWREVLEARGYVYVAREGGWIKTITL